MKNLFALLLAASVGFAAASVVVSHQLNTRHAEKVASQQAAWQAEREQWQAELDRARQQAGLQESVAVPPLLPASASGSTNQTSAPDSAATASKLAPHDILARLQSLRITAGAGGVQSQREMVRLMDDLVRCGPAALRAGLLSAVQEIGGPEAEQVLVEALGQNSRPAEVLKLAQMLEQMAPGKYRDSVLAAAQAQLNADAAGQPTKETGRLYEVLAMYGDRTYVDQAKAQLFQADGRLNKEALDYLQQTLQQENLPLLQELLQNPDVTDPKQKEDVLKFVTDLAGKHQQANQLWYESALNPSLPDKAREKAITELEKRGFQNRDNPTAADLQLAQSRLQLLDALRAQLQDPNQLATVDQTRARLTILMDPNLRQALQGQPKGGKMK